MKVCSEAGCPNLQPEARCPTHRRAKEQSRGNRHARGYGNDHDKARAEWAPLVATGNVKCWRCKDYLPSDQPWDLGHRDDRTGYAGPEHPSCNRATAGRA